MDGEIQSDINLFRDLETRIVLSKLAEVGIRPTTPAQVQSIMSVADDLYKAAQAGRISMPEPEDPFQKAAQALTSALNHAPSAPLAPDVLTKSAMANPDIFNAMLRLKYVQSQQAIADIQQQAQAPRG